MSEDGTAIPQPEPNLPPPGYEREEELKRRADALEEKGEALHSDSGRIDPSKLETVREICVQLNSLEVSNRDPAYEYCWVPTHLHGFFVKAKLSIKIRGTDGYQEPCWEIVQGDMREAAELKGQGVDTTRHLGDCILMRCRKDRYKILQRYFEAQVRRFEQNSMSSLVDRARELGPGIVTVHEDITQPGNPLGQRILKSAQARAIAQQRFTQQLKKGTVPGASIHK